MINLKKINIICLIIICFFMPANAKFKMPSFSKAKEKVKQTINNATQQTKKTFNELVDKAKRLNSKRDTEKADREKLANAIKPVGNSVIAGINLVENELEDTFDKIDDIKSTFIFSNDAEFIENLSTAFEQSKENASITLYKKITKIYNESKAPLLSFYEDLIREYKNVDLYFKKLSEFTNKKEKITKTKNLEDFETNLESFAKLKNNLDTLIEVLNKLIFFS
ncbi:hypothetical protein GF322_05005 [Candidatus Dependentiae bacterium]|nr:hypothetical protein [Candidatus Dependentiae bacterium]